MIIIPEAIQAFKEYQLLEAQVAAAVKDYKRFFSIYAQPGTSHYHLALDDFHSISEVTDSHCVALLLDRDRDLRPMTIPWNIINATSKERQQLLKREHQYMVESHETRERIRTAQARNATKHSA